MSEKCFEFTVAIKATEVTLQKIQDRLCYNTANREDLTQLINEWIKEELIGSAHYFKVEVQAEPVTFPCQGGLNAEEWLETQKLAAQPALEYNGSLD